MKTSSNGFDIDQLLRSYFRRELPARWPMAPHSATTTVAKPVWTMASNRALVGIALVALVAIYMGLATFFPREHGAGLNPNGQQMIGQRPGILPGEVPQNTPEPRP